jgi:glycosyltransferase involved in cell wall biosynthesis
MEYPRPRSFNISAANNIGIHYAKGNYVVIANSDIIYPPDYLETLGSELLKQNMYFTTTSRVQLSKAQTMGLRPPIEYNSADGYKFVKAIERTSRNVIYGIGTWVFQRDIIRAIGGYDPKVLAFEDAECNDRVLHYLRRKNLQYCHCSLLDLYGYHVHHAPSELYDFSALSKLILEPRRRRMLLDPDSKEDVIDTQLDSLEILLEDLARMPEIQPDLHIPVRDRIRKIIAWGARHAKL